MLGDNKAFHFPILVANDARRAMIINNNNDSW